MVRPHGLVITYVHFAEEIPNLRMPSTQPAAPAVDLAAEIARLRERLRQRDKKLAQARKVPQAPKYHWHNLSLQYHH